VLALKLKLTMAIFVLGYSDRVKRSISRLCMEHYGFFVRQEVETEANQQMTEEKYVLHFFQYVIQNYISWKQLYKVYIG
jgi:hypothetical protein